MTPAAVQWTLTALGTAPRSFGPVGWRSSGDLQCLALSPGAPPAAGGRADMFVLEGVNMYCVGEEE